MSEWLSYLSSVGPTLRSIVEGVPVWIWFGIIGLFVMARVGARISREVAYLGRSLENLEVQAGEIQEHLRMIGRTLRLRTDHATVARED
jgi:hypothetical protein